MKRFALLLLAFTMLFVMASAEESFVEEDFAAAASFDDELFAEEAFFGDEFEAEQPALEDEVEDRSVFLFEDEDAQRPTVTEPWQKWEIRDLTATEGKKGKVNLTWSLYLGEAAPSDQPSAQPTKKDLKQKGVKIFIYQVDANTGVPTQVKKPIALSKTKYTVTVKTSGTYTYFARIEKVDKAGNELLGKASEASKPVTIALAKKAVSKVKASYANASEQPSGQPSAQPVVTVSVDVYVKEADKTYTIDVAQKKGETGTATYTPDAEEVKAELQGKGYIHIDLFDNENVKWSGAAPKLEANGKKITVAVKSSEGKAKKGNMTPKAITAKTQPVITSAVQLDATTILVKWIDAADQSGVNPANNYTIAAGKAGKVTVKKADAKLEDGTYEAKLTVTKNTNKKDKAKTLKITVQSDAKKSKKSKAFKLAQQTAAKGAILDMALISVNGGVMVTWSSTVKATYEVYATDSVHSDEVYKAGVVVTEATAQPTDQPQATTYKAEFSAEDLSKLNKGYRWSFTVKAVNGNNVIARAVASIGKDPVPSEQPSEQSEQPSPQKK